MTPPFEVYEMYLALKAHFTRESYDFKKYNGKVSASREAFSKRRDRYQFEKLGKRYYPNDLKVYLIANLCFNPEAWIGDLISDDAKNVYMEYMKRHQSLSYMFKNEVEKLGDLRLQLATKYHSPYLLTNHLSGHVSVETLIILNDFIGFSTKFDKMDDDYLWPKIRLKMRKLKPFLDYDRVKFKDLLKEIIDVSTEEHEKSPTEIRKTEEVETC